jgi:hypothetical protein
MSFVFGALVQFCVGGPCALAWPMPVLGMACFRRLAASDRCMVNAESVATAWTSCSTLRHRLPPPGLFRIGPLVCYTKQISLQAVEKEMKRRQDREALARGEKLEPEQNKPYGDDDEGMQGGIIIPLAPFGIPKYDNGERFDLKVPSRVSLLILHARGLSHAC